MLVFGLILAITLCIISVRRYKKIFNPYTLEIYITVLFLIIPQLLLLIVDPTSKTYIYSDLVIITYLVAVFLGTMVNFKVIKIKPITHAALVNKINVILYVILIIPLCIYFLQFEVSFAGIRSFYETVVFSPYASIFELSKYLLYFIIVMRLFRTDKFDLITAGLSSLLLFYGSKYALFDLIIILFIYYEQFRRLSIRRFAILGLVTGALLVSYRYYQSTQDESVFMTALGYFDLYRNQSLLVEKIMESDHDFYYGRIYFSSYLKYIPRAIWSSKPREFGFAILNYDFFPESAANGYMPAFGLGSIFADLGFVSIFLFGFSAGLIKNCLYKIYLESKNNITFILFVFPLNFITVFFMGIQLCTDFLIRALTRRTESPIA